MGTKQARRGPCMQAAQNEIQRQANDDAGHRSAQRTTGQNGQLAPHRGKERLAQPRTNRPRRNSRQYSALEQKSSKPCCRAARAEPDHKRRRNHSEAHQQRRQTAGDQANGDPDADENQRDDKKDQAKRFHTPNVLQFQRLGNASSGCLPLERRGCPLTRFSSRARPAESTPHRSVWQASPRRRGTRCHRAECPRRPYRSTRHRRC